MPLSPDVRSRGSGRPSEAPRPTGSSQIWSVTTRCFLILEYPEIRDAMFRRNSEDTYSQKQMMRWADDENLIRFSFYNEEETLPFDQKYAGGHGQGNITK